jgi:hypothetical protein
MQPVTVHVQGITSDLTAANGDYDTATYGLRTPQEVVDFFARIQHLQTPPGDDICPPAVTMEAGAQHLNFMMEAGHIHCEQTGTHVTPEQVVDLIMNPAGAGVVRKAVQQQSGVQPLRMHHVPPTSPDLGGVEVDMGPNSPQVQFLVKKTHDAGQGAWVSLLLGFAALAVGGITLSSSTSTGLVALGVGALCIYLFGPLRRRAKHLVTFGFDWRTNTMWAFKPGDHSPSFLPNANLISELVVVQEDSWVDNPGAFLDESVPVGGLEREWRIRANRVDGTWDTFFSYGLYSKKERDTVLNGLRALLAQQG